MKSPLLVVTLLLLSLRVAGQATKNSFLNPSPANYQVAKAIEVEAVPFVYLSGGYHVSIGYRYNRLRFRASIIDAGSYNSQPGNADFKRFESSGSFGIFAGYFVWKNLETYGFVDRQVFTVKQNATDESRSLNAVTPGLGIGYQFFIGRYVYIQPALHLYLRSSQEIRFGNGNNYSLATSEISPIIRVGVRPWKRWK